MAVPSLKEIAAMPFPESLVAMRRHYDPFWSTPPDVSEWRVSLSWEVREDRSTSYRIEAGSPEEAEALARAQFSDDEGDYELDFVSVRPMAEAPKDAPLFEGRLH